MAHLTATCWDGPQELQTNKLHLERREGRITVESHQSLERLLHQATGLFVSIILRSNLDQLDLVADVWRCEIRGYVIWPNGQWESVPRDELFSTYHTDAETGEPLAPAAGLIFVADVPDGSWRHETDDLATAVKHLPPASTAVGTHTTATTEEDAPADLPSSQSDDYWGDLPGIDLNIVRQAWSDAESCWPSWGYEPLTWDDDDDDDDDDALRPGLSRQQAFQIIRSAPQFEPVFCQLPGVLTLYQEHAEAQWRQLAEVFGLAQVIEARLKDWSAGSPNQQLAQMIKRAVSQTLSTPAIADWLNHSLETWDIAEALDDGSFAAEFDLSWNPDETAFIDDDDFDDDDEEIMSAAEIAVWRNQPFPGPFTVTRPDTLAPADQSAWQTYDDAIVRWQADLDRGTKTPSG